MDIKNFTTYQLTASAFRMNMMAFIAIAVSLIAGSAGLVVFSLVMAAVAAGASLRILKTIHERETANVAKIAA